MKRVFSGRKFLPAVVTTVSAIVRTALALTQVFLLLKSKRQRTPSLKRRGNVASSIGDHHDGPNI